MSDTGWILSVGFGALVFLGMPIAFCLGMAALAALYVADIDIIVLAQRLVSGAQSFTLLAVPCFILAGELMRVGGLSRRLIKVAQTLVQHLTGGLGMVTVLSATFFAAISGSAPATTAAIGNIMIPEMVKAGYRRDFSAALASASGPIGQMIPPSIPMVIWGVIAEESITKLFLAGVVPGLMICAGLMFVCWLSARGMGVPKETRRATGAELFAAMKDGKWALLAPVIILGGIYGGIFTPTEAGAIGVLYGLLVGLLLHRELKLRDLPHLFLRAMETTTLVIFIVASAAAFGWLVALEQLPQTIADALLGVSDNPIIILLMLNVMLLVIGAIVDNLAAMVILGGVLTSIAAQIGIDPIHFGAIVVINFAIGMVTPPFGYSLFVGSAISGLSIEAISKALWPMLLVQIVVLMLLTYIPAITLTLPNLL
jgi:tripartite ATP-independent transporter DctM subunit